jgi:hypothetical protein
LIGAAIAVVAVAVALMWPARPQPPSPAPSSPPVYSASRPALAECGLCHQDVFREWDASLHRAAWTNPHIQESTQRFAKTECRACHSPEPVLGRALEEPPLYRPDNHEDGVHCVSCHGLPGGGVAAARTIPDAPCRPQRDERLGHRMMCNPCHEPTHQAMAEFVTSQAFRFGQSCHACHMPPVERARADGTKVFGRSHGPLGGLNPEFVAKALFWKVGTQNNSLIVTLGNQTGHKFPGEISSRSLTLKVEFLGADGEPVQTRRLVLRKPHAAETDWPDNRLTPNEFRDVRFDPPPGAAAARLHILWKPYPLMADEDATVLGRWPDSP